MWQLISSESLRRTAAGKEENEPLEKICICDLAVTPQGRVILALHDDGFEECDISSGRRISFWQPQSQQNGRKESVCTLAVLNADRVIVGLHNSQEVRILSRNKEDKWVHSFTKKLNICPWRVAIRPNSADPNQSSIAVTGGGNANLNHDGLACNIQGPGSYIKIINTVDAENVVSIVEEREVAADDRWRFKTVTLTETSVVALSYPQDGVYLLVAYNLQTGVESWRHEERRKVEDLSASLTSEELYVVVCDSDGRGDPEFRPANGELEAAGDFRGQLQLLVISTKREIKVWLAMSPRLAVLLFEDMVAYTWKKSD